MRLSRAAVAGVFTGRQTATTTYTLAATLDTGSLGRSCPGGVHTRVSSNHFQSARSPLGYVSVLKHWRAVEKYGYYEAGNDHQEWQQTRDGKPPSNRLVYSRSQCAIGK